MRWHTRHIRIIIMTVYIRGKHYNNLVRVDFIVRSHYRHKVFETVHLPQKTGGLSRLDEIEDEQTYQKTIPKQQV